MHDRRNQYRIDEPGAPQLDAESHTKRIGWLMWLADRYGWDGLDGWDAPVSYASWLADVEPTLPRCAHCGRYVVKQFDPRGRPPIHGRTCSDTCRKRAWEQRNRGKALEIRRRYRRKVGA